MDQYGGSAGHISYCYAVSSLAVAKTIISTHCTYSYGQASFINFLCHCSPSSAFYGAGKITEACTNNPSGQLALCAGRAAVADIFVRAAANDFFTRRATAADDNLSSSAAAMHCL